MVKRFFQDPERAVEEIVENDIAYDLDKNVLTYEVGEGSVTDEFSRYSQMEDIAEYAGKAVSYTLEDASEDIYSLKFSGDDWENIYCMGRDQGGEPIDLTGDEEIQPEHTEFSGKPIEFAEDQANAAIRKYLNSK